MKLRATWAFAVLAFAGVLLGPSGNAFAQDQETLQKGQQLWVGSGCGNCHGARGEGGTSHDFPLGPSLRTSQLDHETLVTVIQCGLPSTPMPAWLKGAYAEASCYGSAPGDGPPEGLALINLMTAEEIESLATFIEARIMKRP